ncbi:hypothetical protein SAMN04487944_12251 [Gracilibacillus ureilyticus]|uniref:Uncharacterized protein n=1 Tax=Gracilibacillus ureilyticus TaxID=531814 RepID=A0A1H9VA01_9BACI|nr:hypothetical protein SAMN04487944_12251 [Gracilibacillus ureilyticus]
MKFKSIVSIIHIFLILFLVGMFYVEMALYSVLPPEQGGMSYWVRFQNIWYSSPAFYGIIIFFLSFLFWAFKRKSIPVFLQK